MAATLVVLLSGSLTPLQRADAATAPECETQPAPGELRTLLSGYRREQFAEDTLQVISAELDGAAPREAVAFADHAPNTDDISSPDPGKGSWAPYSGPPRESVVWVFRCVDAGWYMVAEQSYELPESTSNDSEEYGRQGFKRVKAERLLADRDLLRIEWLISQSVPFSASRSFDLYTLRSNQLRRVFGCSTVDIGHCCHDRRGRSTKRTIQFLNDKLPARIRVEMHTEWLSGADDVPPDDDRPAQESRTEIYRYDGTRFVTQRPACDVN